MSETQTALVTGAGRGLGAHLAATLAREGWHTVICGRSREALEARVAAAARDGLKLHAIVVDVTDEDTVDALVRDIEASAPPIGLCVNNAGGNYSHKLVGTRTDADGELSLRPHPTADWDRTLQVCLTGTFLVGRRVAQSMLEHRTEGVIVNISSAVSRGAYAQSAYSAAKAAVESLTRTWAIELGEFGIRVVAVSPGVIDGDALRRRMAANPRHAAYMSSLKAQMPLQRWCTEADVAAAVMCAVQNRAMTGTIVEVDGGGFPSRVFTH
jgi:3-oxoacyl-[acyl-carrier protein] reductase